MNGKTKRVIQTALLPAFAAARLVMVFRRLSRRESDAH